MTPTYIWTDLGGPLTLVGATSIDRGTGIFRYAPDYEGPAIDPINLPVSDTEYRTAANKGVFGVLSDAGPDSWGKRVLAQMHPKRMSSAGPLDVLVLAQGGVGSLLFSASRDACKPRHHGLLRNQLGAAAEGAQAIDQGHDLLGWASYAGIAELRRRLPGGSVKADARELFRRMAFNVLIGNTDDHGRNHGFLMNRAGEWSLAPAFDLLPTLPGGDRQALGVGPRGAARDIANVIAGAALLGIHQREARKMVDDTNAVITGRLPALLNEAGVSAADRALCRQRLLPH